MNPNPTADATSEGEDNPWLLLLLHHHLDDPDGIVRLVTGRLTRAYNAAYRELDAAWHAVDRIADRHRSGRIVESYRWRSGDGTPAVTVESIQDADAAVTRLAEAWRTVQETSRTRDAFRLATGRRLEPTVRVHSVPAAETLAWAYGGRLYMSEEARTGIDRVAAAFTQSLSLSNPSLADACAFLVSDEDIARMQQKIAGVQEA